MILPDSVVINFYEDLDNTSTCVVINLDFKKGLDSVPHGELLLNYGELVSLFCYGIGSRRTLITANTLSTPMVLSLLLSQYYLKYHKRVFLRHFCYINDIPEVSSRSTPYIFVDDTKLIKSKFITFSISSTTSASSHHLQNIDHPIHTLGTLCHV